MSKCADPTKMTAETASKTETTKGRPAPAFRKPTQTRAGRLRQEMIDSYIAALGGNVGPIVMQDVIRVADLTLLASHQRAELAGGRAKIADVVKLEGTLARAVRRLNLPESGPSKVSKRYGNAEPVPTPLQDYFAGQAEDE
jgi:hypothetical protein